MPVMNGAEALMKLHDDPQAKNIKVALLTAFGDPETDVAISKQAGAVDYIKKGIGLDELVERVRAL